MRILIVDDSKYQRQLVANCLREVGTCDEAEDGRQAVLLFATALKTGKHYDLVVMDILMPEVDGHKALETIVAMQHEAGLAPEQRSKSIMLSSLDDPKNMMQAQFQSGADIYITKPFEADTLLEALTSLDLLTNPLGDADMAGDAGPASLPQPLSRQSNGNGN